MYPKIQNQNAPHEVDTNQAHVKEETQIQIQNDDQPQKGKMQYPLNKKNLKTAYSTKRWTISECARFFETNHQFISGCLFAWSIPDDRGKFEHRGRRGRRSKIADPEVYTHYKSGLSTRQIAAKMGVSHGTIAKAVRRQAEEHGETPRTVAEGLYLRHHREKL